MTLTFVFEMSQYPELSSVAVGGEPTRTSADEQRIDVAGGKAESVVDTRSEGGEGGQFDGDAVSNIDYPSRRNRGGETAGLLLPPCLYKREIGRAYVCVETVDSEDRPRVRASALLCSSCSSSLAHHHTEPQ